VSYGILLGARLSATLFLDRCEMSDRHEAMGTKKPAHINTSPKERSHRARRWTWWLVPRPFDLMSSLLYLGVLAPYLYSFVTQSGYDPPLRWWQAAFMMVFTFLLLTADRLEYFLYGDETPKGAAVCFLVARVVFIEVLSWLDQFKYTPFLYFIVLFLACLSFGELVGSGLAVLAWIVYFIKHLYYNPSWLSEGAEVQYFTLFTVGIVLVITVARVVSKEKASRRRAEELLAELEASHRQLQEYAGQVAELATVKERNRLARDIHDTLGHFLTVINVQLEKALVFRDKKPQEADQAVSTAKRLAREALRDVRRSVDALRSTQELPEFTSSLTELVEHLQSDTCTVELNIGGEKDSFSEPVLLALYRAVQEGLTNVQRYAGASHIWIDLHFGEQEATLVLRDNGHGFDASSWRQVEPGRDGGYGLQGLQERLELLGGGLQIESSLDQGTMLRVTLPKKGASLINDGRR
jgi:signal transduction histidine kinase